jgi:hypothetical protein
MKDLLAALLANPEFMNAIITAIAGVATWAVAKLFTAKPAWKKYEGLLITAVKAAEKIIPDDPAANTSLARADAALRVFNERYAVAYGKFPTDAIITVARLALPIVHDQIEAEGTL